MVIDDKWTEYKDDDVQKADFVKEKILSDRYYCLEWLQGAQNRLLPHKDEEICTERDKCLRRYFSDLNERLRATKGFVRFSGSEDVFSQYECLQHRWSLEPREWWIMYGSSVPLLQNLVLKLLSQPCSSSCCERNWSTYSFIHSYKEGETKMWDIGGDRWEHFDGPETLEVASLSLDELELEPDLLAADGGENDEIPIVEV
ncbi:Dimer_Tnp_hAT domain-containing protein [Senna tora]|uniref:Dimer_Tnp_hAT domain-containing protein n=1 Tax=Senna tora TaxID=362788 RepID=A0A834SZ01_9FABA|nr:Dimer_Tnp_hAT domain-containing protein [Senna tora]